MNLPLMSFLVPYPQDQVGSYLLVYCQFQSMSWGALAAVDNISVPFALPDKKVDAGLESRTGCAPVWLLCSHLTQHSCCSIHHQRSSMSPKVTSFLSITYTDLSRTPSLGFPHVTSTRGDKVKPGVFLNCAYFKDPFA